nr:hypothetical protein [Tanacetum cinerariifolium]
MNKKQVPGKEYQITIGPQVAVRPDKPFGAWAVAVGEYEWHVVCSGPLVVGPDKGGEGQRTKYSIYQPRTNYSHEGLLVLPLVFEEVNVMRTVGYDELLSKVVVASESSVNDDSFKKSMFRVVSKVGRVSRLKKYQEKDKIGSKPDKNGKCGEAGKSQK